uniref:Transthyretin-like family protein n=1 Tax=Romanomermis culicivorax TaxID=13658 RepID=A0A915HVS4_ROMCU
MLRGFCLFSFLFCLYAVSTRGEMQRVKARGQLLCGTKPAANVKVKLIDIADWISDDVMDERRTDENGVFELDGQTDEKTDIDPSVQIFHDCYDGLPCQRTWQFEIPKKYIGHKGKGPEEVFDAGKLNLEVWWYKEDRNCIKK